MKKILLTAVLLSCLLSLSGCPLVCQLCASQQGGVVEVINGTQYTLNGVYAFLLGDDGRSISSEIQLLESPLPPGKKAVYRTLQPGVYRYYTWSVETRTETWWDGSTYPVPVFSDGGSITVSEDTMTTLIVRNYWE